MMRLLRGIAPFAILVAAWALVTRAGLVAEIFLPRPEEVARTGWEMMRDGSLWTNIAASLGRVALGLVVTVPLAVAAGVAVGLSRRLAEFTYPLLNFFQSVSGIAWLPLMLVWFGFGERTILVAVNYTVVFPVALNALLGVRSVPRIYVSGLRTLGASRWRIARDVILPGALPSIATGMRLGLAYGWRALIAAEMLVGAHGLGFMIFSAQNFHLTARIVLGMLVIGALWLVLDYFVFRPLEQATIERWGLIQR